MSDKQYTKEELYTELIEAKNHIFKLQSKIVGLSLLLVKLGKEKELSELLDKLDE